MAQEFRVGIIGGGPAGCFCAYNLQQDCDVTIFEMSSPLKTLLVTGGGRCNLAHAEYDFRELTKFYPRGEKFLYSVFSKFGTADTLEFFNSIGVETYTQDDNRIFPTSNSAADVREKFLNALKAKIKKEKALRINQFDDGLEVVTDAGSYKFDAVVMSIGGHAGYNIAKYLGHNIIDPKPALVGLKTDKLFPSGVVLKNVKTKIGKKVLQDDLLFTHNGISGPLAFKISSLNAREKFPYTVTLDVTGEIDLQKMFDANPHKTLKNLIGELVPKSFAAAICPPEEIKCSQVSAKVRESVLQNLRSLEIKVLAHSGAGEVVTCGGIDLKEINPKTMESKLVPNLYFCGEVMDIDGFCGGFNLQNCWSTAYIASKAILC
ncbi:MAG: aminoacetone oxidase family FAD-binding enzyme [Fusobacterium sp.]|nr:aminoacetone oxidase family FAD-binding enzyme [Fusobacterium sp.]